jgi:hypothetical protein
MAAVPLGKTIEASYRFAFAHILSVFGIIWLPSVIFLAALGAAAWLVWPDIQGLQSVHFQGGNGLRFTLSGEDRDHVLRVLHSAGRFAVPVGLVGLAMRAMIAVGVLEKALGRREKPVFVYFSLAAPVWRMIGASLLAGLILSGIVLATCIGVAVLLWGVGHYAGGISGLAKFALAAAAVTWIVYMALRLVFFLPAVVVAEERIGLARAWMLGGGNVWRILGLVLAVLLPAAIVASTLSRALTGGAMAPQVAEIVRFAASPTDALAAVMSRLRAVWPVLLALNVVYATVVTGLGYGAMANAYKAVTAPEEDK